jgi:two-component system sensor histidine kinase UhpB
LAVALGPSVLEDLGLCSALDWLADRVRVETGLRVDLRLDCDCAAVPHDVAVTMFRVAQEALTNVVRHAAAGRAEVSLTTRPDLCRLVVTDDGMGFDTSSARTDPTSSVGLFGMEERLALVGGALEITSSPGNGTRIEACAPIEEEARP